MTATYQHSEEECRRQAPEWLGMVARGGRDRETAARRIFDCYYRRMTRYVASTFHLDDFTAEEIVQEAMIKGFKGAASFRGGATVYTWLVGIAIREAKNHFRKLRTRPDRLSELRDNSSDLSIDANSRIDYESLEKRPPPMDPALQIKGDFGGGQEDIQQCIDRQFALFFRQNPKCGEMIRRFYFEGWSSKELAAVLGKTDEAVRTALKGCRQAMRSYLAECEELRRG